MNSSHLCQDCAGEDRQDSIPGWDRQNLSKKAQVSSVGIEPHLTSKLTALCRRWEIAEETVMQVHRRYPFLVSPLFEQRLGKPGDPLWRQFVPDPKELDQSEGFDDPLGEEHRSPVPNLVHRYPDRVLWITTHACAVHCRFCTRKRRWSRPVVLGEKRIAEILLYIRKHPEIRDVLLSGGDPFMLPTEILRELLTRLREIEHVWILRIGTRVPFAQPSRISSRLIDILHAHQPVYVNLHVNHPLEITPEAMETCRRLADAGVVLGSQTVLLRGINDRSEILSDLFMRLLSCRIRPYYLLQMDLMAGTGHFRTSISAGLRILEELRGRISGLAIPHYVVDLPGGYGKVPLVPRYIERIDEGHVHFRIGNGVGGAYPLLPGDAPALRRCLV